MPKKILIVDDSETVRLQLRKDLTENGFEVVEAFDGVDGLEQLRAHKPDFILCDVNMPRLDGLAMCAQVRKEPGFEKIPIFMLTTEAGPDAKKRAKEIGITAWITKPYEPAKLIMGLKKVLGVS